MNLFYRQVGDKVIFFGPGTFHKKDTLKSHGARFNGVDKTWVCDASETVLALAVSLGAVGAGGSAAAPASSTSIVAVREPTAAATTAAANTSSDPAQGLTISQLMAEAQRAISAGFPNPVWVVGELQNVTRRSSNLFFEIAETKEGAHATATLTVKGHLWGTSYQFLERRHGAKKLEQLFVDGTKVRFLVRVSLYKDRGQVTVTIEDVDPSFSQGAMALARAELLKKLRSLGLDKKNKALPLPAFPLRIAFISAPASRAQTDFEHQLTGQGLFPGTLIFIPCPMQGDRVPKAVVSSIKKASDENVDLIVISRGGGSAADLRWFDGEEIALAIASATVPVIAAIGHHDDHCVAEEICHTRQKTPTAAAEFILDIFRQTRTQLNEHAHWLATVLDREMTRFTKSITSSEIRLVDAVSLFFQRQRDRLNTLVQSMGRSFAVSTEKQSLQFARLSAQLFQSSVSQFTRASDDLNKHIFALDRSAQQKFTSAAEQLAALEQQLVRVDPSPWLKSGWTQLTRGGSQISSIEDVSPGDQLSARLLDGVLKLSVTEKKPAACLTEKDSPDEQD